ncbi:MAG: EVE domain-containing protein [Pseudobdellovibrio sp.]
MKYWLMKSEPDVYSLDHLKQDKTTWWEGVRNYQARNFMMNDMQIGDLVLFYHSNSTPSGIAGLAEISKTAEPDKLQFDKKSEYYDAKATKEKPIWFCTEVKFKKIFKNFIPLDEIKNDPKCSDMILVKRSRLSVQPVTKNEFDYLTKKGE